MKVIRGNTAKGRNLLAMASSYEGTELYSVYGSYSSAKAKAMEDCKRWCKESNGYNFHITSHSAHNFTVAWNYINTETGEVMTRIETAWNTYIVDGTR